jgi:hypothetical protein
LLFPLKSSAFSAFSALKVFLCVLCVLCGEGLLCVLRIRYSVLSPENGTDNICDAA